MFFLNAQSHFTLIPVVTPIAEDPAIAGKIRILSCAPQVRHAWLVPYDNEGKIDYEVAPKYKRQGYVLLRDLFEAEGRDEDWAEYQRMLADIAAKKARVQPFPDERLPAEVHRRRACGRDPEQGKPRRGGRAA